MTPEKKKAEELVEKFLEIITKYFADNRHAKRAARVMHYDEARSCARLAVQELIADCKKTKEMYEDHKMINSDISDQPLDFWIEVNQEIDKL